MKQRHHYQWKVLLRRGFRQQWVSLLLGIVLTISVLEVWQKLLQEELQNGIQSSLPTVVLLSGLLGSWMLAFTFFWVQRSERQARQTQIINQQLQNEITHRQQIETSLRQSEERWYLALRGSSDGIWDWNIKTNEVFFSSRWQEMLGFEGGEIPNRLEEWSKRVHPDDLIYVSEAILDHFSKKTPFYIAEHRVQCKDSSYKWILARGQALWDEAGSVMRMVGSHTDITERKQAEIALQESEARYQQLVNHMNVGFVVHTPNTHIVQCNTAACELLGLSLEQLLGKVAIDPAWHFVREDGTLMPVAEFPVNVVLSTGLPLNNYILGIDRNSQSRVWALVTAYPEFDANQRIKQVVVIFIDISQLKQAERNLRETTAAMENAISGISRLDTQGRYLYINKTYAEMTGYQPEEMVGMDWQQTVHPDDLELVKNAYQRMLQDGKVEVEAKGVRKDGSIFYKRLVLIATYNEQQQFVGHYCFGKDISDRKRSEAERKQSEIALQNSQARFAGILEIANDAIISVNANQQITLFNQGAEKIFGYQAEEVLGQPLALLIPDRFAQAHHHHVNHYAQSESNTRQMAQRGAIFGRRKDGTEFPAEASISKLDIDGEITFTTFLRDISERVRLETASQQSERALRESEARFQSFMHHSPAPAWISDSEGKIFYLSQAYISTFQIPDGNFIGRSIFDLFPVDIAQLLLDNIQTVARTQQALEAIELAPRRDGRMGTFLVYKFPMSNSSGQLLIGGVAIDITQQQQAEEALRQSEATKQAIIQAIPDLLMRMHSDGSYIEFISNSHFNIINPDQVRQDATVYDVLPAHLAQLRMHYTQLALESNTTQIYEQEIVIEGEQRYEEVRIVSLLQDEVLVMVRDITNRKQSETALQLSQERLQLALEASGDGLWDWNIATGDVYYSPQYMTMLGYDISELPQNFETWKYLTHPDDQPWVLDKLNAHIKDSSQQYSFDYRVRAKSSEWKWVADYGKVVARDGQGNPLRMIGTHRDISDRKQKEAALRQAMEAAEAANLTKSMFLANMSHELRTPLNVILGFSQVMSHDPSLTPSQLEDLQTIRRSGDYLLSLINDVLDLSKIEAGHCTLEESGFDLISLLHSLRTMMAERAQVKHLQLTFDIAPNLPQYVIADEQKLRQVLLNLLSNAIKFTKQGSVTLQVTSWESSEKTCLIPNLLQTDDALNRFISTSSCTLQIKVTDTGVGIAVTEQEAIFDAFTQAEAGRKSMNGTGLGLTISRKLLELMHGRISVESTPGVGSTFTVTVPVCPTSGVDEQAEQQDRTIIGLAPGQPHRRILVVDDQRENRKLLVRLLTHLGLEVQEATNGQEAIDLWLRWKPDLIWMDIRMPVLDGYEATKQIRAMEQDQASIIIALTAQASQSDRALALAAGCNDYISKPFREETLFLKLREYLGLEYLYADSEPIPSDSSRPSLDMNANHLSAVDPAVLAQMPADWLATLEDLAVCGNDKAIVDLANQLPPKFDAFRMQLLDLANRFEFEQIVHLIHRVPSS